MPFKHVAHASRAVGEGKVAACEKKEDLDTLKPRTFHATTGRQPHRCLFTVAILVERTTRVDRARIMPSIRSPER